MNSPLVIRGRFSHQTFIPDGLLPEVEGPAELIVYIPSPEAEKKPSSIFDYIGKASILRTAEDIEAQIQDEKQAWDKE